MGANVDNAVKRATGLAACSYLNPYQKLETLRRQMDIYRGELNRIGKPFQMNCRSVGNFLRAQT